MRERGHAIDLQNLFLILTIRDADGSAAWFHPPAEPTAGVLLAELPTVLELTDSWGITSTAPAGGLDLGL